MGTFVPPARGSAPGVRSVRSPERQDSHDEVTTWFVRWCDARCISVRDLAEILGTSAPLASRKRRGETPITLVDIRKFPARYRHTLIASSPRSSARSIRSPPDMHSIVRRPVRRFDSLR